MKLKLSPAPSLKGKRILVTGGSSGFGKALVEAFLKDGARIATCARDVSPIEALKKKGAIVAPCDVSRQPDVDGLFAAIRAEWGGLDAVINNAAVLHTGPLLEQRLDEWAQTQAVNVTGPLLVTRGAAALMDSGSIVNVTSGLGRFVMEPYHAYCVSKAALEMLTRCTAQALEGRIRVNALDPGVARSRMNPTATDDPADLVPSARALAALGPGGPTGKLFKKDGSEVDWN